MGEGSEGTRLMVTLAAGTGAPERLSAALGAAGIAAVVIEPSGAQADQLASLVALARKSGAAALVAGSAAAAASAGADGAHVAPDAIGDDDDAAALVTTLRGTLGKAAAIGVDAAGSRHRAMIAGEAGADYVAFGIDPALAAAEGAEAARDDRLALVAWWAEIFETACVALDVADADEAAALAEHGADLVDIRLSPGRTASDTVAFVEAVARAVATRTHRRNPETIR